MTRPLRATIKPLLALFALLMAYPSQAKVKWLQTEYDFGTWHEAQGKRTGIARFVNTGPDTVAIASVRPSCGCTGADWSQDPVAPGDTAWVSFTYDPTHRPGRFEKTVKVYTAPGRQLQVINIRGTVVGTPETLQRDYPVEMGGLRRAGLEYDFGATPQGTPRHGYLTGYNQASDTIRPTVSLAKGPLDARIAAHGVAPGEPFTVGFFLTTRELSPGAHSWPVRLHCGGKTLNLTVSADIEAVRPALDSAQMARAPRVAVPSAPVEIPAPKGGRARFRFQVRNDGLSPLHLARVYSRAEAVRVDKAPRTLKPGKSGEVEGSIDLSAVDGPAYGFVVEIITDDPLQPVAKVRVLGRTGR